MKTNFTNKKEGMTSSSQMGFVQVTVNVGVCMSAVIAGAVT